MQSYGIAAWSHLNLICEMPKSFTIEQVYVARIHGGFLMGIEETPMAYWSALQTVPGVIDIGVRLHHDPNRIHLFELTIVELWRGCFTVFGGLLLGYTGGQAEH